MPPESPRIAELRRRVEADPTSIAFAPLAEEYRRAGNYEAAEQTCRTGLARHPGYLSARVTLGRTLIERGDLEGAEAQLQFVLEGAADNLAAIRGMAEICQRRGDLVSALEFYRRALPLARQDPEREETVNRIDRDLHAVRPAAPIVGLSFEEAQSELLDALARMPEAPPEPIIVRPEDFPALVAPAVAPVLPDISLLEEPTADPHGMDFESLLHALGAPDHPTPPTIEALLSPSVTPADPEPIGPELPSATPEQDPFASLEEALRQPPPSFAVDPQASLGETSSPSPALDSPATSGGTDPAAPAALAPDLAAISGETRATSSAPDPAPSAGEPSRRSPDPAAGDGDSKPAPAAADPFAGFPEPGVATLAHDPTVAVAVEEAGPALFAEHHVASVVVDALFDAAANDPAFAPERAVPETVVATMQEPPPREQNVLDELEAWLAAIER